MFNTVLFDLDGTLTDPKVGITKSVQYALKRFDIEVNDLDELIPFIGPPLKESFMAFYGLSEEQALQAITYYREYFSQTGILENELYAGIPELLAALKQHKLTLAIATSKPTPFAEKIADHFDFAKYFDVIVGSNLDNTRTSKHEVIEYTLKILNKTAGEAIMIGDRKHDLIGASLSDMPAIGVLYGYGSQEELSKENPYQIVEDVAGLQETLCLLIRQ
ncbi:MULTISPECIES: HAD family hydrolase [Vibrio]|uniref:HAD hydrolase-like protein n=2 Tax=Vibrio TaxID=662 RepID=A0A7X4LKN7_9VIBR|nr:MULTISPECIES: HAD family hydrolase [Vibrio]MBF9002760.1 HAD family hydrolase [Vibrio nitrifigilis]MZI93750.1 HAD hydrolase-like protein [Vibrio eleionomae]